MPSLYQSSLLQIQIGGKAARRLMNDECPLQVQEFFLKKIGIAEITRRERLAIDPEFKYILRFFIGPSSVPNSGQATKSGSVEILKGHVFPQWMRRSVVIIGSLLIIYPGSNIFSGLHIILLIFFCNIISR